MGIKRIALLSVHTSPLAALGGKKTGGMNVYIRELARELAGRGIEVDIFTRRSDPMQPEIDRSLADGVQVVYLNAGPAQYLDPDAVFAHVSQFTAGVIGFATRYDRVYDLVYSHYWLSGWVANKLKEVWNTPFIQMFHTLGHMKHRIASVPLVLPDQRISTETEIVNWADQVIAATPAELTQLLWLYRANRRKITIIPPGVDTSRFYPRAKDAAREQLGLDATKRWLLFVGRIEPLKAVDTILEALYLAREAHPEKCENVRLLIVGGDPKDTSEKELMRLQAMSSQLGLNPLVEFIGAKDHETLPLYYAAAEAIIMPSDYESFGMVGLEAMATGTPVIASEVGGLAFLVRDGQTGYLVPARDAAALSQRIVDVLDDPAKSAWLGENAALVARDYSWPQIADQLLGVFERLLERKRFVA